jgi:hypothetical protein
MFIDRLSADLLGPLAHAPFGHVVSNRRFRSSLLIAYSRTGAWAPMNGAFGLADCLAISNRPAFGRY